MKIPIVFFILIYYIILNGYIFELLELSLLDDYNDILYKDFSIGNNPETMIYINEYKDWIFQLIAKLTIIIDSF